MMKNKLPPILIVAAALVVLALAIALRRGVQSPEAPREQPGSAVAGGERVRSARVEERLQVLREAYARGEHAADAEAQPRAGAAPHDSAGAERAGPPNIDTREMEGRRGQGAAWQVGKPAPAAGAPQVATHGFKHDPHTLLLHYGAGYDQHWDSAKIEDTILNGTDAAQRRAALALLPGEEDSDALRILTTALAANAADPKFRAALVAALDDYTEQISADLLDPALHDEDPSVRFEALSVLADMDGPAARTAVQAAVNDADPDVRDLAQGILEMQ